MRLEKWVLLCAGLALAVWVWLIMMRPEKPAVESLEHSIELKEHVRDVVRKVNAQSDPAQVLDAFDPAVPSDQQ